MVTIRTAFLKIIRGRRHKASTSFREFDCRKTCQQARNQQRCTRTNAAALTGNLNLRARQDERKALSHHRHVRQSEQPVACEGGSGPQNFYGRVKDESGRRNNKQKQEKRKGRSAECGWAIKKHESPLPQKHHGKHLKTQTRGPHRQEWANETDQQSRKHERQSDRRTAARQNENTPPFEKQDAQADDRNEGNIVVILFSERQSRKRDDWRPKQDGQQKGPYKQPDA